MKMLSEFICLCMKNPDEYTYQDKLKIRYYYDEYGRETVFNNGRNLKILPYLAHSFICCKCDELFWKDIHEKYEKRNRLVLKLLEEVFEKLEENGISKVCVSENFGAILSSDACLACFSSGDIDLYCDDLQVEKLDEIMTTMGFTWDDRHARKKSFAHEYRNETAIGETWWLNFQWKPMTRKKTHLYDQRYIMQRYHSLFNEVEYYKDTKIKLFKPEAAIYLNCVHISSGHYYILPPGIRLYPDIDRLINTRSFDWQKLMKWIENDKLGIRTDVVFHLSKCLLGTEVPQIGFTNQYKSRKFQKLIDYIFDEGTLDFKYIQKKGYISNFRFLIKVELMSDGTSIFRALWRRLIVLFTD